jgi:hypothetical protein
VKCLHGEGKVQSAQQGTWTFERIENFPNIGVLPQTFDGMTQTTRQEQKTNPVQGFHRL